GIRTVWDRSLWKAGQDPRRGSRWTPAAFDFHAAEGRSWRLTLDGDGARTAPLLAATGGEGPDAADVSAHATAGELILFLYDRIQAADVRIDGDAGLFDLLRDWEPEN
ncbi:hypothetical protein ABZ885_41110, partial [Kitasatospora sp. NPDC047058]